MFTRRQVILGTAALGLGGAGTGGYAVAIEPYRLRVQQYRVQPKNWPTRLKLRVAAIADLHVCEPWMPLGRVQQIVERTNDIGADLIVLLGDFVGSQRVTWHPVEKALWSRALGQLRAPLGVHAIMGNHDWWEDVEVQRKMSGTPAVRRALEAAGIPVYQNDARRLNKAGIGFWICGLGDQWAFYRNRNRTEQAATFGYHGVDDLPGLMAKVSDEAPILMMVHEPDIFHRMPARVALTMAGHTHGGQVQFFGYAPIVPSRFGRRYVYGHVHEDGRDLIVSGGLGCSGLPIRFGRPPEIVVIDLEA
ncbi:MAG: metallophosphoesterase [Hyphomicrobiaceae bacterium]